MNKYKSFTRLLDSLYPGHNFGKRRTNGYWNNHQNVHNFLQSLQQQLNLRQPQDWLKLTNKYVARLLLTSL